MRSMLSPLSRDQRHQAASQMLLVASGKRKAEIAKALIEEGADVDYQPTPESTTAIVEAAVANDLDMMDLLIKNGANTGVRVSTDGKPLSLLCGLALETPVKMEIVSRLIRAGGDVNATCSGQPRSFLTTSAPDTALELAAYNGNLPLVKLLAESAAASTPSDELGMALLNGALQCHLDTVAYLFPRWSKKRSEEGLAPRSAPSLAFQMAIKRCRSGK